MSEKILEVKDVSVYYSKKSNAFSKGENGSICAANHLSLSIGRNEIHGLVGESGSGKSTLGRSIMKLAPISEGEILFYPKDGTCIHLENKKRTDVRIQMVFQDSNSSLNPNMKLKQILAEPILINHILSKSELPNRLKELMNMVALPVDFLERYPHQLSGGQRQRIAIARAMATKPELIIADEPTSALDVSVQAQILNLLMDIRKKEGLSILFISHNLAVVRHISDNITVMKKGEIVECGETIQLFERPKHEYTKKLWSAIPQFRDSEMQRRVS